MMSHLQILGDVLVAAKFELPASEASLYAHTMKSLDPSVPFEVFRQAAYDHVDTLAELRHIYGGNLPNDPMWSNHTVKGICVAFSELRTHIHWYADGAANYAQAHDNFPGQPWSLIDNTIQEYAINRYGDTIAITEKRAYLLNSEFNSILPQQF